MITTAILAKQLREIGLVPGDMIMVHASLRAVGLLPGGPNHLIQTIIDAISPIGTLMMYVGCEPEFEAVGRGKLSLQEEQTLLRECPAFDYATARARRDYGVLAELFRSYPGVICSRNPGARIAALGAKAEWLVANHPLNYGYGTDTPLAKLYESNGKLLLLGSDLDQVTILHYAEHIAPINNKHIVRFKVHFKTSDGARWVDIEEYDTSVGIRQWPDRFFETILTDYINANNITAMKVGIADSYLLDVKALVDFAIQKFIVMAE